MANLNQEYGIVAGRVPDPQDNRKTLYQLNMLSKGREAVAVVPGHHLKIYFHHENSELYDHCLFWPKAKPGLTLLVPEANIAGPVVSPLPLKCKFTTPNPLETSSLLVHYTKHHTVEKQMKKSLLKEYLRCEYGWRMPEELNGIFGPGEEDPHFSMIYDAGDTTGCINEFANKIAATVPESYRNEATRPGGSGDYRGACLIVINDKWSLSKSLTRFKTVVEWHCEDGGKKARKHYKYYNSRVGRFFGALSRLCGLGADTDEPPERVRVEQLNLYTVGLAVVFFTGLFRYLVGDLSNTALVFDEK